jgi:chemotaxis protein MotA
MDLATLIGIILGFGTLIGGMIAKGADPAALINPAALIIIFIGTTSTIFTAFPMKDVKKFGKLLGVLFKEQKNNLTESDLIPMFESWATIARKKGILGIEK